MLAHINYTPAYATLLNKITSVCISFPPNFIAKCISIDNLHIIRIHIRLLNPTEVIANAIENQVYSLLSYYTDISVYATFLPLIVSNVNTLRLVLTYAPLELVKPLFKRAAKDEAISSIIYLCDNFSTIIGELNPLRYSVKYCKVKVTKVLLRYFVPTSKHLSYRSTSKYYMPPHVLLSANRKLIRYYYPHIFSVSSVILLIALTYIIVTAI